MEQKIPAYFNKRRKMWRVDLAETICESTQVEAERVARLMLALYAEAKGFDSPIREKINELKGEIKDLQAENKQQTDFLVLAKEQMDAQAKEIKRLKGQADGYCAEYTKQKAENKRLKEVLEEAWGVVEELVTQCASDVATGCWPARLGYSEKDVKRINKNIEQIIKETQ